MGTQQVRGGALANLDEYADKLALIAPDLYCECCGTRLMSDENWFCCDCAEGVATGEWHGPLATLVEENK